MTALQLDEWIYEKCECVRPVVKVIVDCYDISIVVGEGEPVWAGPIDVIDDIEWNELSFENCKFVYQNYLDNHRCFMRKERAEKKQTKKKR